MINNEYKPLLGGEPKSKDNFLQKALKQLGFLKYTPVKDPKDKKPEPTPQFKKYT